jgi:hypothetical protein
VWQRAWCSLVACALWVLTWLCRVTDSGAPTVYSGPHTATAIMAFIDKLLRPAVLRSASAEVVLTTAAAAAEVLRKQPHVLVRW